MRSVNKHIIIGAAFLAACICGSPVHAFAYFGGDEVYQMLGLQDPPADAPKQEAKKEEPAQSKSSTVVFRKDAQMPTFSAPPADLKIIGYWVGNMLYRVGTAQGRLYVVNENGETSQLPNGTDAANVAIPMENAFVQGILNSQPVMSEEAQLRRLQEKNGGSGQYVSGGGGLLRPTVIATRTMVANGKPMIVGGAIIQELAVKPKETQNTLPPPNQTHTEARVLKDKSRKTAKRAKHAHKTH